ncbi:MAG TPA: Ig-like domain-containing protein [Acidimicrobiia bacterium]|nr:Ig-like domain-containing protein [Acidimicrobiia bacterium]
MRRIFRRAAHAGRRVGLAVLVSLLAGLTGVAASVSAAPPASALDTSGYWLVGTDGGIFSFGRAGFFGSTGAIHLNQPIAGMAATPDGRGYWMVASDGGIFAFGDAAYFGSMGGKPLNQPIVAMAATRTGKGYWLVASDGGIFAFGDAPFYGSMGSTHLNKPIVDIVPTPSGHGYWMAASDGGIFAFGDAGFFGSTGAIKLAKRIEQMAATPTGRGYWMVAGDGGVFAFGDAAFYGSAADTKTDKRIVDIAPSASGKGYYMTASNGAVYAFGDAKYYGGAESQKLTHGVIAMVAMNNGEPPTVGDDALSVDEDSAATLDVLVNDADPEGGPLTIQSVSAPAHGTASFAVGTVAYRPAPNYRGPDSFTYTVADAQGNTAVGTVNVTVRPIDDLPRANDDTVSVPFGAPFTINVVGNDTGLGDGLASVEFVTRPLNGTLELSPDGRSFVYNVTKKGTKSDSFVYRIFDTDGDNSQATVHINITGADTAPNAVDYSAPCTAGTCSVDVSTLKGFSAGDNGQVSLIGEDSGGSVMVPGKGSFSRNGNTISFSAVNGSVGQVSAQYHVLDDPSQESIATITFQYQNSAPVANAGTDTVPANTPKDYQMTGSDPDGDPISILWGNVGPQEANAASFFEFHPDGTFHFFGAPPGTTWTVTFRTFDGSLQSPEVTYTITVPSA